MNINIMNMMDIMSVENTIMPDLRGQYHPDCIVCGPNCPHGLRLMFALNGQGVATGTFDCDTRYEGYPGIMHGGVISALLDGAMTNCLFLHGRAAVTAQLIVNFRHPVRLNAPSHLRAWITCNEPPVFRLRAELLQDGVIRATARAAFMLPKSKEFSIPDKLE